MDSLQYDPVEFPAPSKMDYTERGWNHPQFAALLYPMSAIENLYSEQLMCVSKVLYYYLFLESRGWSSPHMNHMIYREIMHDIENGVMDISESEWPAFLYPQGKIPDFEDDRDGLFMGYLLTRVCPIIMCVWKLIFWQVFRHIFTSPRSALNPDVGKRGRASKARKHNLTSVTGRTIAYTCVIVSSQTLYYN
jgi:hypothetical protein